MANLYEETQRLICTLCNSEEGPYVVSSNDTGEVHAIPLSSVSGCEITVNAGTTNSVTDDSLGTASVRCLETIHLWSPDGTVNINVTDGSAIIALATSTNIPPTITISAPPGQLPPNTIIPGTTVTVDAVASDVDGDVDNITYYLNDTGTVLCNLPQPGITTCDFTPLADGTYSIFAIATDDDAATGLSNVISVDVVTTPANLPPTITISAPPGQLPPNTILTTDTVTMDATAIDVDGTVTNITYYLNDTGTVLCNLPQPGITTCDFNPTAEGSFNIFAIATDDMGATGTSNTLTIDVFDTPPVGFFALAGVGNGVGDGSFANPWNLRDGLANIPNGDCLNLLAGGGPFDEPIDGGCGQVIERVYILDKDNVTVKPWDEPTCSNPYPAKIVGGIYSQDGRNNNTFQGIHFYNNEPPAFDPGNPPPPGYDAHDGTVPIPTPPCWFEWGMSGPINGTGDGNQIINCYTSGGSNGLSSFQHTNALFYGNITWDNGWTAPVRNHGHAIYMQNPSPAPADKCFIQRCLFATTDRGITAKGNFAGQWYKSSGNLENISVTENFFKGPVRIQSLNFQLRDFDLLDNIFAGIRVGNSGGTDGDGVGIGSPTPADDIDAQNNTMVNIIWRLQSPPGPPTASNDINNRVFKTNPIWQFSSIGGSGEVASFTDVSGGGGTDEFAVYDNAYDAKRGNLMILDLDLDGSVDVDFSSVVSVGQTVCLYHYKDPDNAVDTFVYGGGTHNVSLVDSAIDRADMFFFMYV